MKLLLPLLASLFVIAPLSAQQSSAGIKWHTNYQEAFAMAKKQNKPMLLFFTGSDWCGWCKKLDKEVFMSPEFADKVGNKFVFVELDFPMNSELPAQLKDQNAQLKQRYGVTGYPTVILLDASGGFLAETGYRAGGGAAYARYLEGFF